MCRAGGRSVLRAAGEDLTTESETSTTSEAPSATVDPPPPLPPAAALALASLRRAVQNVGSVSTAEVLSAIVALEKAKLQPDGWDKAISAPGGRWRLIYTAGSKEAVAATKGEKGGSGSYVPIVAVQKYDAEEATFENGIFLGPVAHLTFKGPYVFNKRVLTFGVTTMSLGLGPWRLPIQLGGLNSFKDAPKEELKKSPFFVFSWADEDLVVARGRSGGLALWANVGKDSEWQAQAGVLQVYR